MLAVKALLVDFDGTACVQDVSEMLLDTFGEPGWERFDEAVDRGEMGLREAGAHQVAMLRGYCKYLLQTGVTFSQAYMEETLARYPLIARLLVEFASRPAVRA